MRQKSNLKLNFKNMYNYVEFHAKLFVSQSTCPLYVRVYRFRTRVFSVYCNSGWIIEIIYLFLHFCRYPSTDSVKEWPEYNNNTKYYIDFSKDIQTRQNYKQNFMDFWMRHTEQWMIGGKETI